MDPTVLDTRTHRITAWLAVAMAFASSLPELAYAQRRVELKILVIASGADPGTTMVRAGLDEAQVPYEVVDLQDSGRPTLTKEYLASETDSLEHANFQAVVVFNNTPTIALQGTPAEAKLSEAEWSELVAFEKRYKIRELDAYVYPSPSVGLNTPLFADTLDGMEATVVSDARSEGGPFAYLKGSVPFDDLQPNEEPNGRESYGYLATPATGGPGSFTPFVEMPIPNSDPAAAEQRGAIVGVFSLDNREQMVFTAAVNQYQLQQQLLFPGMLKWLTRGIHLGTDRNYFGVHVDDVFLPSARWSCQGNCTMGVDCPNPKSTMTEERIAACKEEVSEIRMIDEDVDFLRAWQDRTGHKLDLVFNGKGYLDEVQRSGKDSMGQRLVDNKGDFYWISHTYSHEDLDEVDKNGDPNGFADFEGIRDQIWANVAFAKDTLKLPLLATREFSPYELVTGKHSGLRGSERQKVDNPNLVEVAGMKIEVPDDMTTVQLDHGILWIGADNSRDSEQRPLGKDSFAMDSGDPELTRTVPRYPMNIFYNVGTKAEEVDEYNWIYGSAAMGGSGLCEEQGTKCLTKLLDPNTAFDTDIKPIEARNMLMHTLLNSPRPHYVHQANLAEDRIIYLVVDEFLTSYERAFASNTPLAADSMTDMGKTLQRQARWARAKKDERFTAYVEANRLVVEVSGDALDLPLTVPTGVKIEGISSYAGSETGWHPVSETANITLPSSPYAP